MVEEALRILTEATFKFSWVAITPKKGQKNCWRVVCITPACFFSWRDSNKAEQPLKGMELQGKKNCKSRLTAIWVIGGRKPSCGQRIPEPSCVKNENVDIDNFKTP